MINEQIAKHDKIYINEAGQELYPPVPGSSDNFKRVKPREEWSINTDNLPPKALAEIAREQKTQLEQSLTPEEKAAYELLMKSGKI